MKAVLHLTTSGSQLWRKTPGGWETHEGELLCPTWVLCDLPEESFAEMQIPRIFGSDRVEFVQRQLVSRFPDTPFRATLPIQSSGALMERVFPPRQTMVAIDAAQRVNAALDALTAPIAGVWATSMLLANIGGRRTLPPDLFVVFPEPESLRIVFIKGHVPVLSRLVSGVVQPQDQAAEITRTLRHLENTRILNRSNQHHPVLFLGQSEGIEEALAKDRLDLIAPPNPWAKKPQVDWHHVLFDLVLTSPQGQLAPMARRTNYVAGRLRQPAYTAAAISLGLALWLAGQNLIDMTNSQRSKNEADVRVQQLTEKLDETDQKMTVFGVSADLVSRSVALDKEEILTTPSLGRQLRALGQMIGRNEAVRLDRLEWRVMQPGQLACALDASPPPAEEQQEAQPKRLAEINLGIFLSRDYGEKVRAQLLTDISSSLKSLDGATLLRDPAKTLGLTALRGGTAEASTEQPLSWCLTLPAMTGARS